MKKNKLTLDHIEVKSFITTISDQEKLTIQGEVQAAAGTFLISGCLTSLRCSPQTVLDDLSGTWTKARHVGICKGNSRNDQTAIDMCPDCVKKQAAVAQVDEQ